jgi:6-phosphogluconolactonase (cycloisomerase 2 family)
MTKGRFLGAATGLAILVTSVCLVGAAPLARSGQELQGAGRSFLYTIINPDGPNEIAAYERNTETGELIFIGTYPTGGRGNGTAVDSQAPLVVNPQGTLLFAVNPGSNDISVMAIRNNGSLDPVGPPVSSRGVEPASLALGNGLLYVANKGNDVTPPNYVGFRVASDGTLGRIKRRMTLNIGDNPTQVLFNQDGSTLIGLRFGSGGLDTFSVGSTGKLRQRGRLDQQRGPFAGVFNPLAQEQLVVADARLPGATSYLVQGDRSLAPVSVVSNAPERAACWIVVHSDGSRAWVSNTGTNSISLFTIDAGGRLSLAGTHSTLAFGRTPFELALSPDNRFLYQLNIRAGSQSIHALRVVDGAGGAELVDVGAVGLPAGSSPIGLAVVTL